MKYTPIPHEIIVVTTIPPCNFCKDGTPGPYDFATRMGPWANGCERHYREFRAAETLGTGRGQLWITEDQVQTGPAPGIDPEHPLARAARANDTSAEQTSVPETLRQIGLLDHGSEDDVQYVARQRAIRVLAAAKGEPITLGGLAPELDELDEIMLSLLELAYIDGISIGWNGRALSGEGGSADA